MCSTCKHLDPLSFSLSLSLTPLVDTRTGYTYAKREMNSTLSFGDSLAILACPENVTHIAESVSLGTLATQIMLAIERRVQQTTQDRDREQEEDGDDSTAIDNGNASSVSEQTHARVGRSGLRERERDTLQHTTTRGVAHSVTLRCTPTANNTAAAGQQRASIAPLQFTLLLLTRASCASAV